MPLTQLQQRAESIRQAIKNLRVNHNNSPVGTISISIGISIFPTHSNEMNDLIAKADAALYQAKSKGRDCIVMFNDSNHVDPNVIIDDD